MMTVLIGMFLLGLLIALGTWTVSWSNHVKRELVVKIDFKTNADKGGPATKAQENAVVAALQHNQLVSRKKDGWTFVSKTTALKQMRKSEPALVSVLPWNPFPDVIIVKPDKGENLSALYNSLHPLPAAGGVGPRRARLEPDPPFRPLGRVDLLDRGARPPDVRVAPDREHDPAVHLLAQA
jgi:cell division protein FtsX